MHPYWLYLGPLHIRAYGTIFVTAFVLGLIVAVYILRAEGLRKYESILVDSAIWLLIGGVVGARFWQVFFFDWPYYRANLSEIPAVWHGGLSIQGGLVGAILVGLFIVRKHKLPLWPILDAFAPGMILGQSIGRDANLMNGDAFGSPNPGGFGLLYPSGSLAAQTYPGQTLWPSEVWEGQADVIIFCLLLLLLLRDKKKRTQGSVFFTYLILYNGVRFLLEMLRGDSPRFLGWTAAQWTAIVVVILCILGWGYLRNRQQQLAAATADQDLDNLPPDDLPTAGEPSARQPEDLPTVGEPSARQPEDVPPGE